MSTQTFPDCSVELSAPVEVGRAAGHHWFPSLHPLTREDIFCCVVRSADQAQGKWPAWMYLSRDSGRTWRRGTELASYGPISRALAPDRLLLMPYELWPLHPGDRRNLVADGHVLTLAADGTVTVEPRPVRYLGMPRDVEDYHAGELYMVTNGNLLPLRDGRLFSTIYGRFRPDSASNHYTCVAVVSDDGGFTWQFRSIVADWPDTPGASEGPDENNTCRLPDGRLLCICRVGSGRAMLYRAMYSADEGQTWTKPLPLPAQYSVEPQLVCLEHGIVALTGGRPGIWLWVAPDGRGEAWHTVNLAAHHNATVADPALHFHAECVAGQAEKGPAYTTSYTGTKVISPDEVLIAYDRLGNGWHGAPGPWGKEDAVFVVRARITRRRV